MRVPLLRITLLVVSLLAFLPTFHHLSIIPSVAHAQTSLPAGTPPILFVSRQIPANGTIYWNAPKDMPGVGPYSRFRVAAPGRLMVLQQNGAVRTLVDGANPTAASLNLIDVNAPDVSYDGRQIVFAGFSSSGFQAAKDTQPLQNPNGWRLYIINADGTGLRQIPIPGQNLNYSQFGSAGGTLTGFDDTDPVWLPDGRIAFASTRWPSFAHYGGVRTTDLYVVNANGSGLHRITAERNGADRPVVDPKTGKIVYARWWRNHRFAIDSMATVGDSVNGYSQKDGLSSNRGNQVGGFDFLWRNSWHAATINPDGTELGQFGGPDNAGDSIHSYGGAFDPSGNLIANFFPMMNMTEAAGFGGLRRYHRGLPDYDRIIGITNLNGQYVNGSNPTSFGVYQGVYVSDPAVLSDGRMVVSYANSIGQDYGLYLINANGGGLTKLYDRAGTTELRSKLLAARPLPPIINDSVNPLTQLVPPTASGPYNTDGTFVFDALNVYANAPVDTVEASAPPVGSAAKIRFFADFQRTSTGSFPERDWPILLGEKTVNADGSVQEPNAPAGIPLFEQIRSPQGTVPVTRVTPGAAGAAHVAGLNFGMKGDVMRCVGCHSGHTQIDVPANDEDALWSNLAPGATVRVSSTRDSNWNNGVIDRRVMRGPIYQYWQSAPNATTGQWVELTFQVPIIIRNVRLYNPRFTDGSTMQVQSATVRLGPVGSTSWVASKSVGQLAVSGTDVTFANVQAQKVRVEIGSMSGRNNFAQQVASIAEIEVIARGGTGTGGTSGGTTTGGGTNTGGSTGGTGGTDGATQPPANQPPTVKINSPANGSSVTQGVVNMAAAAADSEDGNISNKITWRSSLTGGLGSGANIAPSLTVGTHVITATVSDNNSQTAQASITINVTAKAPSTTNTAPKISILSPSNGASVPAGSVTFRGSAADAQDGDISSKIIWFDSVSNKVIGKGGTISANLIAGTHTITASAVDAQNAVGQYSIKVNVTSGGTSGGTTTNQAPTVRILSPANNSVFTTDRVQLTATATDPEDGDRSAYILWISYTQGVLGKGPSITPKLVKGKHYITAHMFDSNGVLGRVGITITMK